MKKLKVIIFIAALVAGITIVKVFGFSPIFNLPTFRFFSGIKGSGVVKTEKRKLTGFKKIKISRGLNVEVVAQKDFNVEVESDDNLLEFIKTEVADDTLKIYTVKKLKPTAKIRIAVALPELVDANVSGAARLTASDINSESLNIDVSGAGRAKLNGNTANLKINSSGAAKIYAENLQSVNAILDISGASKITVNASEEIRANASGASKISYVGEPKNIIKNISGASKIYQQ